MERAFEAPTVMNISGDVIARDVSYEDFLNRYDGEHVEWIDGVVITMSPVTPDNNRISGFASRLLATYLELAGGGEVFTDPVVMRLPNQHRGRAPDIQVVLPANTHLVQGQEIAGPADLVVEVISPGSQHRDRVEKFAEYERAGVKEYWILDPTRHETLFYVLNAQGLYELQEPDEHGVYHSVVLDHLTIPAGIFWRDPLPNTVEILQMVQFMLGQG